MKIKGLIVLFVFFILVILLSLFITQQNNNTTLLSPEEAPKNAQSTDYSQPFSLPIITTPASLPLAKSGITVIKAPPSEPENKPSPVQVEKSIQTLANTSFENSSSNSATQGNTQAGITIIGKHPTPKETNEMNSAGIVMY